MALVKALSILFFALLFTVTTSLPTGIQVLQKSLNNGTNSNPEPDQKEEVKKIAADHPSMPPDYPVVTKQEPQREMDKLNIEDLKVKCQQLARLLNLNAKNSTNEEIKVSNHKYVDSERKPNYVSTRPFINRYSSNIRPNGFYVTSSPSTTTKKPTVPPTAPVKYIRLEPVILQKTILADGRTVYYWHRSLPTAVEYPNGQDGLQQPIPYSNGNFYGYPSGYYIPGQNQPTEKRSEESTTDGTTTSTTEESYGYGLSNFIPFYGYSRQQHSTTSTEPTTTTTPKSIVIQQNPDDLLYAQQLKFVIPVPVEDNAYSTISRQPWDFDPYAYYPKALQPSTVNVQVPYTPTFHVIRAVTIPKYEEQKGEE